MRVRVSPPFSGLLKALASRRRVSVESLVEAWIQEKTSDIPGLSEPSAESCLCPTCPNQRFCLGLCPRHYQRTRWFVMKKLLNEGWLIRHGRMLPRRGVSVESYALASETLETLPHAAPDGLPDTKWMFGYPEAPTSRARLEAANK